MRKAHHSLAHLLEEGKFLLAPIKIFMLGCQLFRCAAAASVVDDDRHHHRRRREEE